MCLVLGWLWSVEVKEVKDGQLEKRGIVCETVIPSYFLHVLPPFPPFPRSPARGCSPRGWSGLPAPNDAMDNHSFPPPICQRRYSVAYHRTWQVLRISISQHERAERAERLRKPLVAPLKRSGIELGRPIRRLSVQETSSLSDRTVNSRQSTGGWRLYTVSPCQTNPCHPLTKFLHILFQPSGEIFK